MSAPQGRFPETVDCHSAVGSRLLAPFSVEHILQEPVADEAAVNNSSYNSATCKAVDGTNSPPVIETREARQRKKARKRRNGRMEREGQQEQIGGYLQCSPPFVATIIMTFGSRTMLNLASVHHRLVQPQIKYKYSPSTHSPAIPSRPWAHPSRSPAGTTQGDP